VIIDHDVDGGGLGAAEPVASPDPAVLLPLPAIASIDTYL